MKSEYLNSSKPKTLIHRDGTKTKKHIKTLSNPYLTIRYTYIPNIQIDMNPTLNQTLSSDTLSMEILNGYTYKITYHAFYSESEIDLLTCTGTVINNTIEITDDNAFIKLKVESPTKLSLTNYKNTWHKILISDVTLYSPIQTTASIKITNISNPVTSKDLSLNINETTTYNNYKLDNPMAVRYNKAKDMIFKAVTFGGSIPTPTGTYNGPYYLEKDNTWWNIYDTNQKLYFNQVYYYNSMYIGICRNRAYYSLNGYKWVEYESNDTVQGVDGMYYANGLYIIWGRTYDPILSDPVNNYPNTFKYSTDLSHWYNVDIDIPPNIPASSCEYANGVWVSPIGTAIYYSENGTSWHKAIDLPSTATVKFVGGLWIAYSIYYLSGDNTGIWYSLDGKTWTQSNITSGRYASIAYSNNLWVIGGSPEYRDTGAGLELTPNSTVGSGVYYSEDGKTWTQSNLTNIPAHVLYTKGVWFATDSINLYKSLDGKYWELIYTFEDTSPKFNSTCLILKKGLILIGFGKDTDYYINMDPPKTSLPYGTNIQHLNNLYFKNTINDIRVSKDCKTWEICKGVEDSFIIGTPGIYFNNTYIAGGSVLGGYTYSEDGITWYPSNLYSLRYFGNTVRYNNILVASFRYVSGLSSSSTTTLHGLWYSLDGKTWTQSNITDIYGNFTDTFYVLKDFIICHRYLAKGISSTHYSTDGKTWEPLSTPFPNFEFRSFTNNTLFGIDNDTNNIYYSKSGLSWSKANIQVTNPSIVFDNDLYILRCSEGIYYSSDGKIWVSTNIKEYLAFVTYKNNMWLAGKYFPKYYSEDGKNWLPTNLYNNTDSSTTTTAKIYYINGVWISCGEYISTYYSIDGKHWIKHYNQMTDCIYKESEWFINDTNSFANSYYFKQPLLDFKQRIEEVY